MKLFNNMKNHKNIYKNLNINYIISQINNYLTNKKLYF